MPATIRGDPGEAVAPGNGAIGLIVIGRLADRQVGVMAAAIERILRMAALTPLPDAPPGVAGVLDLYGEVLPVVDPRPALGLPRVPARPEHHLIVIAGASRWLLWLDEAVRIVEAPTGALHAVTPGEKPALAPFVAEIGDEVIPLLSLQALDPGPLVRRAAGA